MKTPVWENFFREKMIEIFTTSDEVLDFGGTLRLNTGKSNRVEPDNDWLLPYIKKVNYLILDPVPDYNPDIIADIHDIPFADSSKEAIICMAVLEHVENPIKAMEEMYRVLKPGGKLFIYVPFLFYYHAEKGYFSDYWRFTKNTLEMFAKPFSHHEICFVKAPIETFFYLSPVGKYKIIKYISRKLDEIFYKKESFQVSGYNFYLIK